MGDIPKIEKYPATSGAAAARSGGGGASGSGGSGAACVTVCCRIGRSGVPVEDSKQRAPSPSGAGDISVACMPPMLLCPRRNAMCASCPTQDEALVMRLLWSLSLCESSLAELTPGVEGRREKLLYSVSDGGTLEGSWRM